MTDVAIALTLIVLATIAVLALLCVGFAWLVARYDICRAQRRAERRKGYVLR